MPATALEARSLSKAYSGPPLFADLSFRVERGLTAVTGRNGSGKTTLLKILAGLVRASSGAVSVARDGVELSGETRRLAVGWAGPDLALYGELTAEENLSFFRKAAGRAAAPAEIDRRLGEAGLSSAARRRVAEFSSGMRQRLRIAFALLFDPPLLLLDEPMTGLDAEGRALVDRAVLAARGTGAVVLATNDPRDLSSPDQVIALGE